MWIRVFLVFLLTLTLIAPQLAVAQQIIRPSELRQALVEASAERRQQRQNVRDFFRSEQVKTALSSAKIDPARLDSAIATLNAEQLAALAAQTERIQSDFAAGALTNQQLTYVIIALVTAVIILVLVAA